MAVVRVVLDEAAIRALSRDPGRELTREYADRVVETARRLAARSPGPPTTGGVHAADTIHAEWDDDNAEWRIGPDADHYYLSSFVESGTVRQKPQPALRPALDSIR